MMSREREPPGNFDECDFCAAIDAVQACKREHYSHFAPTSERAPAIWVTKSMPSDDDHLDRALQGTMNKLANVDHGRPKIERRTLLTGFCRSYPPSPTNNSGTTRFTMTVCRSGSDRRAVV
jgi:hypothetical protein